MPKKISKKLQILLDNIVYKVNDDIDGATILLVDYCSKLYKEGKIRAIKDVFDALADKASRSLTGAVWFTEIAIHLATFPAYRGWLQTIHDTFPAYRGWLQTIHDTKKKRG